MRGGAGLACSVAGLPAFLLAACGPAAPAVVEIAAPVPTVTVEGDPAGPEDAAAGSGCTWTDEIVLTRDGTLPLCFENEGACFATAPTPFHGKAEVWLPPGEPAKTGARLDLAASGIRLRAWTDTDQVVLHPAAPTVFGQVAVPRNASQIHVDRVAERDLDLSLRAEATFSPRGGALRARVACSAVTLQNKTYSSEEIQRVIGAGVQGLGERLLPVGRALSFSGAASGPALLEVTPEDSDTRVDLLEQSGGRSRIVWWRDDMVLFGWVDSAALGPAPSSPAVFSAFGALGGIGATARSPATRCRRDLALFAQVHDSRQRVGVIEKGTPFDRESADPSGAFVIVTLQAPAFELTPGSRWLVSAGALGGCNGP